MLGVGSHICTDYSKICIQTELSKSRVKIAQALVTGSDVITGMICTASQPGKCNKMPFCGTITSGLPHGGPSPTDGQQSILTAQQTTRPL